MYLQVNLKNLYSILMFFRLVLWIWTFCHNRRFTGNRP